MKTHVLKWRVYIWDVEVGLSGYFMLRRTFGYVRWRPII